MAILAAERESVSAHDKINLIFAPPLQARLLHIVSIFSVFGIFGFLLGPARATRGPARAIGYEKPTAPPDATEYRTLVYDIDNISTIGIPRRLWFT